MCWGEMKEFACISGCGGVCELNLPARPAATTVGVAERLTERAQGTTRAGGAQPKCRGMQKN